MPKDVDNYEPIGPTVDSDVTKTRIDVAVSFKILHTKQ